MIITDKEKREENMKECAKERRKKYYQEKTKNARTQCDVCGCLVHRYYFNDHVQTKRHQKWASIQQKQLQDTILKP